MAKHSISQDCTIDVEFDDDASDSEKRFTVELEALEFTAEAHSFTLGLAIQSVLEQFKSHINKDCKETWGLSP